MEWKALEKKEERFITAARHQKEPLLNRKLERLVPEKLEDTLNLKDVRIYDKSIHHRKNIPEGGYGKYL